MFILALQADISKVLEKATEAGEPVDALTQAVAAEVVYRTSQHQDAVDANTDAAKQRWRDRDVSIITNANTLKANNSAMNTFAAYLKDVHNITEDPTSMQQAQLIPLLAGFV